jgi:hypothetical protein
LPIITGAIAGAAAGFVAASAYALYDYFKSNQDQNGYIPAPDEDQNPAQAGV